MYTQALLDKVGFAAFLEEWSVSCPGVRTVQDLLALVGPSRRLALFFDPRSSLAEVYGIPKTQRGRETRLGALLRSQIGVKWGSWQIVGEVNPSTKKRYYWLVPA